MPNGMGWHKKCFVMISMGYGIAPKWRCDTLWRSVQNSEPK
jgi:hypothetical protein